MNSKGKIRLPEKDRFVLDQFKNISDKAIGQMISSTQYNSKIDPIKQQNIAQVLEKFNDVVLKVFKGHSSFELKVKDKPLFKPRSNEISKELFEANMEKMNSIQEVLESIQTKRTGFCRLLKKILDDEFFNQINASFNFGEVLVHRSGKSGKIKKFDDHFMRLKKRVLEELQQHKKVQEILRDYNGQKKKEINQILLELKKMRTKLKQLLESNILEENIFEKELNLHLKQF